MRKIFACFLIACCFVLCIANADDLTSKCSKHGGAYQVSSGTYQTGNIRYVDASYHEVEYITYYGCEICNVNGPLENWVGFSYSPQSHSYEVMSDGGHVHGTNTHLRNLYCGVCDRYYTDTVVCSGPPCALFMSVPENVVEK